MVVSPELVLAAITGADLALQYGRRLVRAYKRLKTAGEDTKAKVIIIEAIWLRTSIQLEFIKRIANTLQEEHCRIHIEVLDMLKSKLMKAITKIESIIPKDGQRSSYRSEIKRWKYLLVHKTVTDTISELEQWQRIFDPTWFLVLRIGNDLIDSELARGPLDHGEAGVDQTQLQNELESSESPSVKDGSSNSTLVTAQKLRSTLSNDPDRKVHITLSEEGLNWEAASTITHSTTRIVPQTASQKLYAVDTIHCDSSLDMVRARADAEALAQKLAQVEPNIFNLLQCHGLVKRKDRVTGHLNSISLVFRLPSMRKRPKCLRQLLTEQSSFSLAGRVNIACQLAKAVSLIHTCDFVHKNIRPETILVFPEPEREGTSALGSAYLLGFDSFRSVNFMTMRVGDIAWERNLYRHPSRQGLLAQENYVLQHDVYSLGVCLLELGLWETFVEYESEGGEVPNQGTRPSSQLGLEASDLKFDLKEQIKTSSKVKGHLVEMARSRLPVRMGDKYAAVVVTCLTCLDADNEDFGDELTMRDEDGILVGVKFIERVLLRLGEISI